MIHEQLVTGVYQFPDTIPPEKGKWVVRLPRETQYFDTEEGAWEHAEAYMDRTK